MSSPSESEPLARPGSRRPLDARADEERALALSRRHRWYAVYLGRLYASAVRRALAGAGESPLVLKTDLWNERLGGERDVLGRPPAGSGARYVGIDMSFAVCAHATARTPNVRVVQADIRALPVRSATFDTLLDLSVLDHVDASDLGGVLDGYRRVLREGGTLLVVFWQRSAAVRLRLWLKRALGRTEKEDQRYFELAAVHSALGAMFDVAHRFAAGTLLLPPLRATGAILGLVPAAAARRLVIHIGEGEAAGTLRHVLQHIAGLYGLIARAR
jgi:SAM-dependent methyltransferase